MAIIIDDRTLLNYLFQSLTVNELKQICRDFNIKGFSKLKRDELVEFILDSLAEEEISQVLKEKEIEIISKGINLAIDKINGNDRETISAIRIVNPDKHELELDFKGFNWKVTSFLSITPKNIDEPDRDCDCRVGSNMGFCGHFWAGFITSLKKEWFNLKEWTLTKLPEDFEDRIKSIKSSTNPSKEKGKGASDTISLVDESSDDFQFMNLLNNSITIYEGEVEEIAEKQSEYQGNITTYYITKVKNVRIGPRVQKKSDYREEAIEAIDELNLRISEKVKDDTDLEIGDKISGNGKLMKDNFLKVFIVKNIRKITKI